MAATSQADRAQGAILGSLVADAATMGLHWIYDLSKLQAVLQEHGRASDPCFMEPPSCPYYQASGPAGAAPLLLLLLPGARRPAPKHPAGRPTPSRLCPPPPLLAAAAPLRVVLAFRHHRPPGAAVHGAAWRAGRQQVPRGALQQPQRLVPARAPAAPAGAGAAAGCRAGAAAGPPGPAVLRCLPACVLRRRSRAGARAGQQGG
jgi:hypothetical protein